MVKKLKLEKRQAFIPCYRSLAERCPLFFADGRAGGDTDGMGAHPGLHHGDAGPDLLLRNEYLAAENRTLRGLLRGRLKFSDVERAKLGEIGHRLGRKALAEIATAAQPNTILGPTPFPWTVEVLGSSYNF
jgi:hypothetical protein